MTLLRSKCDSNVSQNVPISNAQLTSGRLLARNTLWNLAGQLLPMVVAVITVPILVHAMGDSRFGVLSIAWVVIGYFSLFDLGIGRALTQVISQKIGAGQEDKIPGLTWTSLALLLLLGLSAGAVTCFLAPWLVHKALRVPPSLQAETLRGFYLLALSIPTVTLASGFRGALEALQRFKTLNLIRIPMSVYSFAGPLLVLPFSHRLVPVIGVLVAGRLAGLLLHLFACLRAMPGLRENLAVEYSLAAPLLKLGGWMTVSNLLGPAIVYMDRFVIGAVVSVSAVTYYTAPADMVYRLMVIPMAVSSVLFPAFAVSSAQDAPRTGLLMRRGLKYIYLATLPLTLFIVVLSPEILRLWLGPAFAQNSSAVLRWLTIGIFMNSLTVIPFALLHAVGRADITGKVLLADLPIYSFGMWISVKHFGIDGAAATWTVARTLELLIFFALSWRFLPRKSISSAYLGWSIAAGTGVMFIGTLPLGLALKCGFLLCSLLTIGLVGWFHVLEPQEKVFLKARRLIGPTDNSPIRLSARAENDVV